MAIEYKALSGGKEIDSFYSGGKEIQEIWGGDTLLWQKEKKDVSLILLKMYVAAGGTTANLTLRQLILPRDNVIPLSEDNIELGAYVYKKNYRDSNNRLTCDIVVHLLAKAKTKEVRQNIGKIFFLWNSYYGPSWGEDDNSFPHYLPPDYPKRVEDIDRYTKQYTKLIYSNNVFSTTEYSTSKHTEKEDDLKYNGIAMFLNFNYTFYIGGGVNPTLYGLPDLVFDTKEELINWALS